MHIKMTNIYKAFGTNQVLTGVDFELLDGEIHALMGENGAGKSTLMNILIGLHRHDKGDIIIDGKVRSFSSPKEAEAFGVAFIHQELNIWNDMTVLDNLFIGKEPSNALGLLDAKDMRKQAKHVFQKLDVHIPLNQEARLCSVGEKQMIEIAKALMTDAKVIVMDEPTAALTEREISKLFEVIASLKKSGVSLVYISHRMEEIFAICDRITVMRDGKTVDTKPIPETNFNDVVRKMVGRELTDRFPLSRAIPGDVVLEVKGASRKKKFNDINFYVRSGEIIGFSGLMGSGRTEIMHTLFGLDRLDAGHISIKGKQITIRNPHDAMKAGIGFVTEDRKEEGLVLDFSINDNIALTNLNSFVSGGVISKRKERQFVDILVERLRIKTQSSSTIVRKLSGGNQQKVVIAKWIAIGLSVLILDEPTRGVDVGAKREIYQLMNELAERGVAIIMVSSELPEVLGMSNRIYVVHEGKISGELSKEEATQEQIMTYATGGK